jgi:hypothetical protein
MLTCPLFKALRGEGGDAHGANLTNATEGVAVPVPAGGAMGQGLTLVHFSPRPEPFLTQNTP